MTILDVRDLKIAFRQDGRVIEAVRGVSFTVGKAKPWRWWAKAARASR